ncbi:MAG TPA: 30S ribosomal protein S11 [Patescibacteria group bacterium]|nr:30S ribosomal protein S11 [Patescibacteria group bacterium]
MAKQKDTKKVVKKKSGAPVTSHGRVYVTSTFNNTLVTVTNDKGDTLGWSSSGAKGYKGTRKSTPYAASIAVEDVVRKLVSKGLQAADIFIKGPGNGRDSSLRGIRNAGLQILSISDITPMPHNGPRSKKKRRV